ncbi:unnamed protein product [Paramecium pentaurelia]|uniref:Uncharacterized protein n=1 Tax=Paramecium pentaurelia TaxID=43138 RepID=A0A8S1YIS3_9CILI|nr:unnamed protein product [Paramecium pentaurelia]
MTIQFQFLLSCLEIPQKNRVICTLRDAIVVPSGEKLTEQTEPQ